MYYKVRNLIRSGGYCLKRIAELRKELKLSQVELANIIGVSQQTISKYEQGTREPDIETLLCLSRIFNVSTDYLLENSFQKSVISPLLSDEEKDLITYYSQLSLRDRRWIMGQIVDLIKKKEESTLKPSTQKSVAEH